MDFEKKIHAVRTLHELACREDKDKHTLPAAPDGFFWQSVHYSGDENKICYVQLVCELCGRTLPETDMIVKYPWGESERHSELIDKLADQHLEDCLSDS